MKSLKTIIITYVLAICLIIFTLQSVFTLYNFSGIISSEVEKSITIQVEKEAAKLSEHITNMAGLGGILAKNIVAMSSSKYSLDLLMDTQKAYIKDDNLVIGSGFWMEPYVYDSTKKYYGPYLFKNGPGEIQLTWDYNTPEYDYHNQDWYKIGRDTDKSVAWTDPYYDDVSKVTMITTSTPIRKGDELLGVATVDFDIKELQDYASKIKIGKSGYGFIISRTGDYISNQNIDKIMKQKITEEKDIYLRDLGTLALNENNTKLIETHLNDVNSYAVVTPIGETGMKLIMIMPQSETNSGTNLNKFFAVVIGAFIFALVIIITLLTVLIGKKVINPLNIIVHEAQEIANGDLTEARKNKLNSIIQNSKDEMGQLAKVFEIMVDNLRMIVGNITKDSLELKDTSYQFTLAARQSGSSYEQVAVTIGGVADGSTKQSHFASNILRKMENTNLHVETGNEEAVKTFNNAAESTQVAYQGKEAINQAIEHFKTITSSVSTSTEAVQKLGKRSEEISNIITVITEISNQTNLLALNAAIEAARAGDHGKGFAVVAEEVRKLAEESKRAAEQITSLINDIQSETNNTVHSMEKNLQDVKNQLSMIQKGSQALDTIVENVEKTENDAKHLQVIFSDLRRTSDEVLESIKEITDIIEESASSAEEVAALAEESTSTVEEMINKSSTLSVIAERLQDDVNKFKI